MTYKQNRKTKLYILISLIIIIFTNNFQLLFNTRNISKYQSGGAKLLVFQEKKLKTEEKAKEKGVLRAIWREKGLFLVFSQNYKGNSQTISSSKLELLTDNCILHMKRLMSGGFTFLDLALVSVKDWYFFIEKSIFELRGLFLKLLEEGVFPRGRPLAQGLLLGDISSVPQELYHSFKVIGILHLLSASSYNLSLFLAFFNPIFFFFRHFFLRKRMFFLYLSGILFYFSLVGASASIMRAAFLMILAYFAKFFLKRAYLPLYLLLIVGILILFINPFIISLLGFQLSFLASFGIYYLLPKLKTRSKHKKNFLLENLQLSVAAQFFLLFVFVSSFSEINVIGLLGNLLLSPLVESLTIMFLLLVFSLFFENFLIKSWFLTLFRSLLSDLIGEVINILDNLLIFLDKIPYKNIYFNENKELWTAVFILLDLSLILYFSHRKKTYLQKNKYRIFI